MNSYTVSITISIDADSESEACEEAASIMRSATSTGLYDMMEVTCTRDDLELTDDPVRYWLERLPDGYRELALTNYGRRKTRNRHDPNSIAVALFVAFGWAPSTEGHAFWNGVYLHYSNGDPLPPLP